jgi:hypothetical protein
LPEVLLKVSDWTWTLLAMLAVPKKTPVRAGKVTAAVPEFGTVAGFQLPAVFQDSLAVIPVQVWARAAGVRATAAARAAKARNLDME